MKNLLLSTVLLLTLGFAGIAGFGVIQDAVAGSGSQSAQSTEQTQTFNVENMTCSTCPITVKKAMKRVDGVKSIAVDLDSGTAIAVFDPAVTSVEEIAAASTDVGFPATLVSAE